MPSERLAALAIERVERIMALNMSFSRREAWDHAVLQYILDAQEERERRLEQMPSDKQRVICKVVLPEWVQRIFAWAKRDAGSYGADAVFLGDVQGLVAIAAQMADLLPETLRRFRRTEDCIGQGDCLSCPYATEDNGEQCFGFRLAQASERWRSGEVDKP